MKKTPEEIFLENKGINLNDPIYWDGKDDHDLLKGLLQEYAQEHSKQLEGELKKKNKLKKSRLEKDLINRVNELNEANRKLSTQLKELEEKYKEFIQSVNESNKHPRKRNI